MDCSTPGLPVPHHLLKFAYVHVHCTGNAIQPSYPLIPSSPSALNLSQHQTLLQWVSCSHQLTKLLELQHQSFQGVFKVDLPPGIDWFDILAVQGAFWSPLQHHSSKASILWHSCLLYDPALTTIHDHWEDHSLNYGEGNGTPLQYSGLENPMDGGAWWAAVHGVTKSWTQRVGHWKTSLSLFTFMHWRRKWQPTPVFLPRESQGQGSLVGCRLWGRTEWDMTEVT